MLTENKNMFLSKRFIIVTVVALSAVAGLVGLWVTPDDLMKSSVTTPNGTAAAQELELRITGYAFNEDVNQVTVAGVSNLPPGAAVVVEAGAFIPGGSNDGPWEKLSCFVQDDGSFEAKVPFNQFVSNDVLRARAAFDLRWEPNRPFRDVYGGSGEKLWGNNVISDGATSQLYHEKLMFREPIF